MTGLYEQLVTGREAAETVLRSPATIRKWASRRDRAGDRLLEAVGTAGDGQPLYRLDDVLKAERKARQRDHSGRSQAAMAKHAQHVA